MKLDEFENDKEQEDNKENRETFLQSAVTTKFLLGIIALLLICIVILLGAIFLRGKKDDVANRGSPADHYGLCQRTAGVGTADKSGQRFVSRREG